MVLFLHFCQTYSGAIQAIATVVLIGITSYYAVVTHRSLKVASRQLEASLLPQVSMEFGQMFSSTSQSGVTFRSQAHIYNGGVHPFTISKAEVRLYGEKDSAKPVGVKELRGLKDRLVAGGTLTKEVIELQSSGIVGDANEIVCGKWHLEVFLQVFNALHTQAYKYLYDEQHGIRRLSD